VRITPDFVVLELEQPLDLAGDDAGEEVELADVERGEAGMGVSKSHAGEDAARIASAHGFWDS
jgi:hypothetical protein